jgi:hypothetical protein
MAKREATSKPERIEENRSYDGQHGKVYVFDIEFEDGTTGEFSTTKSDQIKFTVGKEANYSAEDKRTSNGRDYVKIDLVKPASTGGRGGGYSSGGGSHGLSPEVEASITASVCLDCAAMVILKSGKAGQVKDDLVALHTLSNKFFNHIMDKSAGDRQISINYQSRLKEVVTYLMDKEYSELKISSSEDILKYVDLEVAYLQMKMSNAKK